MKSIATDSYLESNNRFILNLHGLKRWIITSPLKRNNLYLNKFGHSEVNWFSPNYQKYPLLKEVMSNEIILQEGELLYIPKNWHHYGVSLNIVSQCSY